MYVLCMYVCICVYVYAPGTFGYEAAVLHTLLGPVPVPVQGTVYRVVTGYGHCTGRYCMWLTPYWGVYPIRTSGLFVELHATGITAAEAVAYVCVCA